MKVSGAVHRGVHVSPPSQWSWETLDFLGVRWFVTNALPAEEQAVLTSHGFAKVESYAFAELWGRTAPPLLRVASAVQVAPSEAERLALLKGAYPLQRSAIVESPVPVAPGVTGTVRDVRVGNTTVRATVEASGQALVVLSDPWYPQWRVYVDGKKAPLLRVDHAFRGVVVPGGTHRVEFRYEDAAHKRGLVLAFLTILGLLGATVFLNRRRRPREE
jgi:hypothetical protein